MRRAPSLILTGFLLALGAVWWLWPRAQVNAVSWNAVLTPGTTSAVPQAARSLEGTVPDGLPTAPTASGAPSDTPLDIGALKRLFDYYLSTVGEQSVEAITLTLHSMLEQSLSPTQARAAQQLLGRYLTYKRELLPLEQHLAKISAGPNTLRQRFEAMQALRAQYFSTSEVQAMFGLEDAYDVDALARLDLQNNPALTPAQKRSQLAALDAALPKQLREDREAPRAVIRLEESVAALRASGGGDDAVYRLRAQAFDTAAADRFADLDREEAQWKTRIENYLGSRAQLLGRLGDATASERQAAVTELQQTLFTEMERKRLAAYEP